MAPSEGIVPENQKLAKVVPIFKSKSRCEFSNYRPISLLPTLYKILEKVVHKRIYGFLSINKMISKCQFGFREKHSTVNAVTTFIIDIIDAFENKTPTLSIFLDLSKAFDTIDHDILLTKLQFFGIRGIANLWFKSYLENRTQYVQYNTGLSTKKTIKCGVPQGSVLGPLLFVIYVNDLSHSLNHCKCIQFADDTTLYLSDRNLAKLFSNVNEDLYYLTDWFRANKLSLNVGKTNYMLFSRQNFNDLNMRVSIAGQDIEQVENFKFLGIILDSHLTWKHHITACTATLRKSMWAINKVQNFVPLEQLKSLYYALVYSRLTYGIVLWGSAYACHLEPLYRVQKKIIRIITGSGVNVHSEPLFKYLSFLKLGDIYRLETAKFTFLYMHQSLPLPLQNIFVMNNTIHSHETRQSHHLHMIKPRTNIALNSILCKGPSVWNSLNNDLKDKKTIKSFSSSLRHDIVSGYSFSAI